MQPHIHIIARAIIVKDGYILLVKNKRETHLFLPGGHVEYNEPIRNALLRELHEELGLSFQEVRIEAFLGVHEYTWQTKTYHQHEINFLFLVSTSTLYPHQDPASLESHLKFSWHPLETLREIRLLPHKLSSLIPQLIKLHRSPSYEM